MAAWQRPLDSHNYHRAQFSSLLIALVVCPGILQIANQLFRLYAAPKFLDRAGSQAWLFGAAAEPTWMQSSDHISLQWRIRTERGGRDRFAVVEKFLTLSPDRLQQLYLPSADNLTIWADESCPAILLTGDILVCGNLFVKGKLTVMQAANTSVYEQLSATEDLADAGGPINLTDTQISRFLVERCTRENARPKTTSQQDGQGLPFCTAPGHVVIPKSGLFISGSLTVMGSLIASSVTVDAAATLATGVGYFLDLPAMANSSQQTNLWDAGRGLVKPGPLGGAPRRSTRRIQQVQRRGQFEWDLPQSVWPEFDSLDDMLCHRKQKVTETLYVPRGMVAIRNRSTLFTFGRSNLPLLAVDRNSLWLSRCGGLLSEKDRRPGDVAILGGSAMWVTGAKASHSAVKAANFVVSEGSLAALQSSLETTELTKVALGSEVAILGSKTDLNSLGVASGSQVLVKGDLEIKTLGVISGALLRVLKSIDVLALELYDDAEVQVHENIVAGDYVVADEGAILEVREGTLGVKGSFLLANHSRFRMTHKDRQRPINIGQDLRLKSGATASMSGAIVGCSVLLDQHSQLEVARGIKVRLNPAEGAPRRTPHHEDIASMDDDDDAFSCNSQMPSFLLQHSSATIGSEGLLIGSSVPKHPFAERNKTVEEDNNDSADAPDASNPPHVTLISGSSLKIGGSFVVAEKPEKHVTVLKLGSTVAVVPLQAATRKDQGLFVPGHTLVLEGHSELVASGLITTKLENVELQDRSKLDLSSQSVNISWVKLRGRSEMEISPARVTLEQAAEAHEGSKLVFHGGVAIDGDSFRHLMSSTGSELAVGSVPLANLRSGGTVMCEDDNAITSGTLIAQDGATLTLNVRKFVGDVSVISETNSLVEFTCILLPGSIKKAEFMRTPEADLSFHPAQDFAPHVKVYRLKVPPSASSSLSPFGHGLAFQQNRSAALRANKNQFWARHEEGGELGRASSEEAGGQNRKLWPDGSNPFGPAAATTDGLPPPASSVVEGSSEPSNHSHVSPPAFGGKWMPIVHPEGGGEKAESTEIGVESQFGPDGTPALPRDLGSRWPGTRQGGPPPVPSIGSWNATAAKSIPYSFHPAAPPFGGKRFKKVAQWEH